MQNSESIKLFNFTSIPLSDLDRILRSLIRLKCEYERYTKELNDYSNSMTFDDLDVKGRILSAIEESVACGHTSCINRILSIINDFEKYHEKQIIISK